MLLLLLIAATSEPTATQPFTQYRTWNDRSLAFGTKVVRDGWHAQLVVGLGGGINNDGLFAAVELGGTFKNGVTLAALHVFLQNQGVIGPSRGADALGGWLVECKVPVLVSEIEAKIAAGLGFVVDELRPSLIPGVGLAYGVDVHLPIYAAHGPTAGITFFHALVPQHYFTVGVGVGYTFF